LRDLFNLGSGNFSSGGGGGGGGVQLISSSFTLDNSL